MAAAVNAIRKKWKCIFGWNIPECADLGVDWPLSRQVSILKIEVIDIWSTLIMKGYRYLSLLPLTEWLLNAYESVE